VHPEEAKNAIHLCARLEGMITDPVYEEKFARQARTATQAIGMR
jgi:1-aminocyclopropane-1-carboxylate deaminase/D-cysteine desulfhydrase-like pyridoxal-dependent ACC family enzyme